MLSLYLDEDSMFRALAHALADRGFDVEATSDTPMRGRPDAMQLAYAVEQQRALVTRNAADFAVLHRRYAAEQRWHPGIVILPAHQFSAGRYVDAFIRLDEAFDHRGIANQFLFLSNWL